MKNGVVSCKWNVYVKLDSVHRGGHSTHDAHMLPTAAKGNAPGFVFTRYPDFALRVWPTKRKASNQFAEFSWQQCHSELPGFNLYCSQQHKRESWLMTGANSAGEEEQVPGSLWVGIWRLQGHQGPKEGGTRHRMPVMGKVVWEP